MANHQRQPSVVTQELFQIVVRCAGVRPKWSQTGECRARHDRSPPRRQPARRAHEDHVVTIVQALASRSRSVAPRAGVAARRRSAGREREVRHETSRARDRVNHSFGHVRVPAKCIVPARTAGSPVTISTWRSQLASAARSARRPPPGRARDRRRHRTAPKFHVVGQRSSPHRQSDVRQGTRSSRRPRDVTPCSCPVDIDLAGESGHLGVGIHVEPRARASRQLPGARGGVADTTRPSPSTRTITVLGFVSPRARRTWRRFCGSPSAQRSVAAVRPMVRCPAATSCAARCTPVGLRIGAAATDVAVQGVVDVASSGFESRAKRAHR